MSPRSMRHLAYAPRESHELEALRVSPHDTEADVWVAYIALAKMHLGAYEEALGAQSDNPVFLKGRERIIEDMRKAGVPER